MTLESAESAAIHVTWSDPESHYDLRWYGAAEFVVPLWWVGISDSRGELVRTAVLAPKLEQPGEVFRWLVPIVGQPVARQLITLAAGATVTGSPGTVPVSSESTGRVGRRKAQTSTQRRRRYAAEGKGATSVRTVRGRAGHRSARAS